MMGQVTAGRAPANAPKAAPPPSPHPPPTASDPPVDLLTMLQRARILPGRQLDQLRDGVRSGQYPDADVPLARRLIRDGVVTEFQARCLLRGKPERLTFGAYVLLNGIGRGAMGSVYKARHRLLGREVALKVIAPGWLARPRAVARFRREMQLIGRLDHPNV